MATDRQQVAILCFNILLLCTFSSAKLPDLGVFQTTADQLDGKLKNFLEDASGVKKLQELYNDAFSQMKFKPVDGAALAKEIAEKQAKVLKEKMDALKEAVEFAEEKAAEYRWDDKLTMEDLDYIHSKRVNESDPNFQHDEKFQQTVNHNSSSVHIPVEIYEGDIRILNGLAWTAALDEIWKKNSEKYPSLLWQYFGSQTGIMRNFPASKWRGEGVDLYDVRRRPWYTQGASSPKDMLILIDTSGSTHGQALALMKQSAKSLLETLGENDFVNVAHFSDTAEVVGCFEDFVQANYRNKKVLFDAIDQLQAKGMASYAKGFEFAFEQFIKYDNYTEFEPSERLEGEGANCNRVIMFLTDGGTEMPEEVFKKYNWPEKKIRIFSYAVGPTANPVNAVKWIACSNRGYFYSVPAMGAIRSTVQAYQEGLSKGLVGNNSQEFRLTRIYEDLWGLGMMTTVTLPVYNRTLGSTNQTILGVMGSDITVAELEQFIPKRKLGPNGYAFAINSNGYIVFHPNLKAVHGWLSDPPNVDLLEVEYETDEKEELRRSMIDGKTGKREITTFVGLPDGRYTDNKTRTYYFTTIEGTTFSVGVVLPDKQKVYVDEVPQITIANGVALLEDALAAGSSILVAPWDQCSNVSAVSNISLPLQDLIYKMQEEPDDCNMKLLYELFFDVQVTKPMDEYWKTELEKLFKTNEFPLSNYIAGTFVATNGGLSKVHPAEMRERLEPHKDLWNAVYYKRAFDNENWLFSAEYHKGIEITNDTVEPIVMATKSISLSNDYKPAVIGVLVRQATLHSMMIEKAPECEDDDKICYLLDDGAFVIASTDRSIEGAVQSGRFFGDVDPVLMTRLYNSSVYYRKEEYDYQGACEIQPEINSAGIRSVFVPAVMEMLSVQWWTTKFAWAYLNFNIYNWLFPEPSTYVMGASTGCDDCVSGGEESYGNYSCIKHLAQYHFIEGDDSTDTKDLVKCGDSTRLFLTSKLKNTNLLLVMAEKDDSEEDDCDKTPLLQAPEESPDPDFVGEKCNVTKRYRFRPACYDFNPDEDTSDCGRGSHVLPSVLLIAICCLARTLLMDTTSSR
jgi:voltage-dependent calcium channel alpha-2/delta-2